MQCYEDGKRPENSNLSIEGRRVLDLSARSGMRKNKTLHIGKDLYQNTIDGVSRADGLVIMDEIEEA
jgi:hypothetical protein